MKKFGSVFIIPVSNKLFCAVFAKKLISRFGLFSDELKTLFSSFFLDV